jgi:hypothetical protein
VIGGPVAPISAAAASNFENDILTQRVELPSGIRLFFSQPQLTGSSRTETARFQYSQ